MPALDLSRDYLIFHDSVSVTYAAKQTESTWAAGAPVTYCQRTAVTKEDVEKSPALLQKDATVFHLWAANLGGVVPKIGDKLLHDSKVWVVQSVGEMDRDATGVQRYRLVVTKSTGVQAL